MWCDSIAISVSRSKGTHSKDNNKNNSVYFIGIVNKVSDRCAHSKKLSSKLVIYKNAKVKRHIKNKSQIHSSDEKIPTRTGPSKRKTPSQIKKKIFCVLFSGILKRASLLKGRFKWFSIQLHELIANKISIQTKHIDNRTVSMFGRRHV